MTGSAHRHLLILGSTGSIGRQALEVLAAVPACEFVGLAARSNVDLLLEQAALHGVKLLEGSVLTVSPGAGFLE